MHSAGKANVAKGPSANTRSQGKHQNFLDKPLTGRAAKRAEKKQQQDKVIKKDAQKEFSKVVKKKEIELKKKAKEYFDSQ
jgi:hypothetical protein